MEFVVSHQDYSVSDFYTKYSSHFPVLVVVTQGWHGFIMETTFDKGQILRLTSIIKRKRVIGYPLSLDDEHSLKCWSIPLDEDINVIPVDNNLMIAGEEMPLIDILSHYKPPVVVEFPSKLLVPTHRHCRFMKLTSVHHVVYMIGNLINCGKLDSKEIEVPLYLSGLRLMLVTGLKNHSKEEFNRYCKRLERMPTLKASRDRHRVVAVYNPEYDRLDTDYTITEPVSFHTIDEAFSNANSGNGSSNSERNELLVITTEQKMQNVLPIPPKSCQKEVKPPSQASDYKEIENLQLLKLSETTTDRKMQNASPPPIPPKSFKKEGVKSPSQHSDSKEIRNRPLPKLPEDQVSSVPDGRAISSNTKSSVSSYSMKEVEQALKGLKLQEHFKTFEEQMVDGRILSRLNEDILVKEFGLSRTESIRLMSFVREGHIPT